MRILFLLVGAVIWLRLVAEKILEKLRGIKTLNFRFCFVFFFQARDNGMFHFIEPIVANWFIESIISLFGN